MSEQHTYPLGYGPETHWAMQEAWAILDTIKPGVLSHDVRNFLAGQIVGTLIRVTQEQQMQQRAKNEGQRERER